jgi:K+-sensing histidine kinase KdpD
MFSRREAGGRSGLGLAIAHAFLDAHGERIWLAPTMRGARFWFTLPVATPPGRQPLCRQQSRWRELTGAGQIVRRVIRKAGELGIDVHVIARRQLPVELEQATEAEES